MILSQIVRGAAEALADADAIDSRAVAHAFRAASDAAYAAVREPVEGTILTVARELADEADAQQDAAIAELFPAVVRRGDEAVARTTEQLDVLRQAGVVDAGAAGLLELVRGIAASLAGEELPPPPSAEELAPEAVHQAQSRFRYCTTFVVEGEGLDADALERELERLGDSLMVVGDPSALKAHVHTDDPDAALALGHARADRGARGATHERRAGGALRGRGRLRRRRQPPSLREPRRRADRPRRPDDEPADRRAARRARGDECRRGRPPAEQRECDPGRRAGRPARRAPGRGRADALPAGRPRRADRVQSRAVGGRERVRDVRRRRDHRRR